MVYQYVGTRLRDRAQRAKSQAITDRELARARSSFYRVIRDFFDGIDFVEVQTPTLASHLIPESAIEVFRTELELSDGQLRPLFLLPSPELYMKILIREGIGDCYQITSAFRNTEHFSPRHYAEFMMLEWYAMAKDYLDNIELTSSLLRALAPGAHPETRHFFERFERLSMNDLWQQTVGIDLSVCGTFTEFSRVATQADFGDYAKHSSSWEELFNRIFISHVEPELPLDRTVFLSDYPAQIPTTAKRRGNCYERWEFYMKGWEIANCYTEAADYDQMKALFDQESEQKQSMRTPHPVDEQYLQIFGEGFPLCSGVALGLDRLFAIYMNASSLDAVNLFALRSESVPW